MMIQQPETRTLRQIAEELRRARDPREIRRLSRELKFAAENRVKEAAREPQAV